jgi:hypothetical protein
VLETIEKNTECISVLWVGAYEYAVGACKVSERVSPVGRLQPSAIPSPAADNSGIKINPKNKINKTTSNVAVGKPAIMATEMKSVGSPHSWPHNILAPLLRE